MNIKAQRAAALKAGQDIIDAAKAASRDLTDGEVASIEGFIEEVKSLDRTSAAQARGTALIKAIGGLDDDEETPTLDGHAQKSGYLRFKNLGANIASGMQRASGLGAKGITPAGETIVPVPVVNSNDPVISGASLERAPRLIDVINGTNRESVYRILKQVEVPTPGAAGVVAPGDIKPTKKLGLTTVEDRLRVVAVLSEPIDKFALEDASSLNTWVTAELADALMEAIEIEVLTGDGTGEHFTGLANTSGIQTVNFATDGITTLSHGLSRLQVLGIKPAFIALAPADWLTIQTTRNAGGTFDVGGPIDPAGFKAWGTQVAIVPGLPAGTGYAVGDGAMILAHDGHGVRADWGTPGDAFQRNQLVARVEGRFNLDVLKPHAIAKLTMTA